jgi:NAD(P)-dependent dehydrogenase (short-subunit alcohol dehydrogenase family)
MSERSGDLFDLSGKTIVVTGGNRGIGLGIARGLARQGAALSIWSRDDARNAEAARELEALGADVHTVACDVSSEQGIVDATAATLDRFGRIDVGFANAGYGKGVNPLELDLAGWRELLSVNLDGAFLTFRELGRHMSEREGGGKLIAVSSISAWYGSPAQPHYAASKGGIDAMVRSFAVALARADVQVNSVQPGWITTEATAPAQKYEKLNAAVMKRTPARRWGDTSDLEGIAVYLASDASRYHTGDTIRVDGGYSIF